MRAAQVIEDRLGAAETEALLSRGVFQVLRDASPPLTVKGLALFENVAEVLLLEGGVPILSVILHGRSLEFAALIALDPKLDAKLNDRAASPRGGSTEEAKPTDAQYP
jgi:hypothetical protein